MKEGLQAWVDPGAEAMSSGFSFCFLSHLLHQLHLSRIFPCGDSSSSRLSLSLGFIFLGFLGLIPRWDKRELPLQQQESQDCL